MYSRSSYICNVTPATLKGNDVFNQILFLPDGFLIFSRIYADRKALVSHSGIAVLFIIHVMLNSSNNIRLHAPSLVVSYLFFLSIFVPWFSNKCVRNTPACCVTTLHI